MSRPVLTSYDHRGLLASAAARLLADRERSYPQLLERGKLKASAADAGLRCARALVAQWQWIVDPSSPTLPMIDLETGGSFGAPATEIAADLVRAAKRAGELASRGGDEQLVLLADCYAALAWLQQGNWIVDLIAGARVMTLQLRAEIGQGRLAA